ncbi:hypothetical protein [Nocardia wallacei]|uniref:hypothetical protein n=1 Tax=Nocardia wallacei TaxID=480035 RepID=UPI0024545DAA|nr:hypothetical protein [Nocardia wallacei]
MAPRKYPEPTGGGARYMRPRDVIAARKRRERRDTITADRDRACTDDDLETALACDDLLVRYHWMNPDDRRTCGRCGWWADHAHHPHDPHPDQWATVGGQVGHMRARDIRTALIAFDRAANATEWTPCPGGAWTEIDYAGTTFTLYLADHTEGPSCGTVFLVDRTRHGQREWTPALWVWLDARALAIRDAYHRSPPATGPDFQ